MRKQPRKTFGRGIFEAEDNKRQGPKLDVYLACLNKMNKEKSVGKRSEKVGVEGRKEMGQQQVT